MKRQIVTLRMRSALLVGGSVAAFVIAQPALAQDSGQSAQQAVPPSGQSTSPSDQSANPAQGMTNATPTTADIVVTGLRGSLQRNLDIKRDSAGVVDAISAEDIGKFPDSNVAAALQRVPGVSISRGTSSLGGLPATTGDATGITVRGFGPAFNETLFDGRVVPTATGNRGFDFSTIGADFVGEVDVLKTPDAALASGAIGATINTKYPKPFDHPGFRIALTGAGSINDGEGKPAGSAGVLVSDTNASDTLGMLVDFAYSQHRTQTNHINDQGFVGTRIAPCQLKGSTAATCSPQAAAAGVAASDSQTINAFYPQDYGIYQEHTTDTRFDGRIALQWKPSDNLVLTVNDDFSREKVNADQYGFSVWFNGPSLRQVSLDGNGTATSYVQPNTPTDFQGQINQEVLQNNEIGANLKWTVSPHFEMEFDGDHADAWLNPNGELSSIDADVGYGAGNGVNNTNLQFINGGANGLPTLANYGPGGNGSQLINNGIIGSHVLPIGSAQNHDGLDQFRVQGTYTQDNVKIRFGGQYIKDSFRLRNYSDFVNNQWQAYSGYGPASGSPTGVALPQSFFSNTFSTANFIPGYSGSLPPQIVAYSPYTVLNYLQGLGNPQAKNIPGYNYNGGVSGFTGVYTPISDPGAYQNIDEYTIAGFLTAAIKLQLGSMPFNVNVGVREESTTTHSGGLGRLPTALTVQTGDLTALNVAFTNTQPVSTRNHYQYLLPNIDMNLDVTDTLKVRFDASRTLTRPALNLLTPVLNVPNGERVGSLVATGGNPTLNPYLSDNLDLGAEWYYKRNSYFAVDAFLKQVSNFIVGGSSTQTINGVINPTTGQVAQFVVTQQINGPSAVVRGVEVAWQQVFGDTGFGFQANGTFVGTNKPYDPNNLSVSGFAVTGLANSANFVGFYDKHGFQARIAANWRDEYLDHFGQQQNNSIFGTEPTFVKASTQLDFSSSYDINKHLNVFFEALNLNDAVLATHGRYSNQILDLFRYGRRFTVGIHVRY